MLTYPSLSPWQCTPATRSEVTILKEWDLMFRRNTMLITSQYVQTHTSHTMLHVLENEVLAAVKAPLICINYMLVCTPRVSQNTQNR